MKYPGVDGSAIGWFCVAPDNKTHWALWFWILANGQSINYLKNKGAINGRIQ